MNRPNIKAEDQWQYLEENDTEGPTIATSQAVDKVVEPGTQIHRIEADINRDGSTDAFEYSARHKDGSSERNAQWLNKDGTESDRATSVDSSGRVTSMSEEQHDKEGNLLSGRYDTNGDGVVDQQAVDVDGDGSVERVKINHERGEPEHMGWDAKGSWDIDADGDGDKDWSSHLDTDGQNVSSQFYIAEDNQWRGLDSSVMTANGATHSGLVDGDQNGYAEEQVSVRTDADGHKLSQEVWEYSNDAENQVVDIKEDLDGDDLADRWKHDVGGDGDLDEIDLGWDAQAGSEVHQTDSWQTMDQNSLGDFSQPSGEDYAPAYGDASSDEPGHGYSDLDLGSGMIDDYTDSDANSGIGDFGYQDANSGMADYDYSDIGSSIDWSGALLE